MEENLVFEERFWGTMKVSNDKKKMRQKVFSLVVFGIFIVASMFHPNFRPGLVLVLFCAVLVYMIDLVRLCMEREYFFRLTDEFLFISNKKGDVKHRFDLKEIQYFEYFSSAIDEETPGNTLRLVLPWDEIDLDLSKLSKKKGLLQKLSDLGFAIHLVYEGHPFEAIST